MQLFFEIAYALVIFLAFALVAFLPGFGLGLLLPPGSRLLLLPGAALALACWIWVGWLGPRYGISRAGLVLYAGVGALGLFEGWTVGIRAAARARVRRSHRPASVR